MQFVTLMASYVNKSAAFAKFFNSKVALFLEREN